MHAVSYNWTDTDVECMRGKLYYDGFYRCDIRNKIVHMRYASGAFAVYIRQLYRDSFCNNS